MRKETLRTGAPAVKVLDKALYILSMFFEKDEFSLKELETVTKLNRSTIYRILQMYTKWGFIEQNPATRRYLLSIKILEMSGSVLRRIKYLDVCRPYLMSLRESTGESAFLSVLDKENIVVVDWEPSYYDAHINVTVGKRVPAHCTGAGKAILAFLPRSELDALLPLIIWKKFTENTIASPERLLKVLQETVERGYAVSQAEYDPDIVVVGAPIFDMHHRVVASCSVAALESRMKRRQQIEHFGKLAAEACGEISRKLGAASGMPLQDAGGF